LLALIQGVETQTSDLEVDAGFVVQVYEIFPMVALLLRGLQAL
jgi:hypothetical protein